MSSAAFAFSLGALRPVSDVSQFSTGRRCRASQPGSAPVSRRRAHLLVASAGSRSDQLALVSFLGRGKSKVKQTTQEIQLQPEPVPEPPVEKASSGWSVSRVASTLVVGFVVSRAAKFLTKKILGVKEEPKFPGLGRKPSSASATTTNGASQSNGTAAAPVMQLATPLAHQTSGEALDLIETRSKKYIIVGGKGGVGKTSMSAALATKFADLNQTTLIISTDPAHSLSDVFDTDVSGGEPVPVVGIDNLYAQEVNPEESVGDLGAAMETMPGMEGLGMEEMSDLLDTVPPGMDEAIALVQIVRFIQGDPEYSRFERIVFDTAPTGHTLRLLTLPDFLDSFFGKIVSMKNKFSSTMNQFKGMFGGDNGDDAFDTKSMDEMKQSMKIVRELFRDQEQTEFIVAAIPNMMAISESTRLVETLRKEEIPVQHVFVNMVQAENDNCSFCAARRKEQQANLKFLRTSFAGMQISPVQFFDKEIRGSYGLRAMGEQLLPNAPTKTESSSMAEPESKPDEVTIA